MGKALVLTQPRKWIRLSYLPIGHTIGTQIQTFEEKKHSHNLGIDNLKNTISDSQYH